MLLYKIATCVHKMNKVLKRCYSYSITIVYLESWHFYFHFVVIVSTVKPFDEPIYVHMPAV